VLKKLCFLSVITLRLNCTKKTHTGVCLSRGDWGELGWLEVVFGSEHAEWVVIDPRFGQDLVLAGEGVGGVGWVLRADRQSGKPLFPVDGSGRSQQHRGIQCMDVYHGCVVQGTRDEVVWG